MENYSLFSMDLYYFFTLYSEDIKVCATKYPICVQNKDYNNITRFETTSEMYRNYKL